MLSGALAWYLTDIAMQNTSVAPHDWLLTIIPIAVLFTAFAVGGVANAINIFDGFNGISSGAVAIMMGAKALNLGDLPLATVCFMAAASAIGFGDVNLPLDKIFLGDGGWTKSQFPT